MEIYSEHVHSQTLRARELNFWGKVHLLPLVMCHMSHVICQVSGVICIFFLQSAWLGGGGSVINGATPYSLKYIILNLFLGLPPPHHRAANNEEQLRVKVIFIFIRSCSPLNQLNAPNTAPLMIAPQLWIQTAYFKRISCIHTVTETHNLHQWSHNEQGFWLTYERVQSVGLTSLSYNWVILHNDMDQIYVQI